MSDCYAVIMAGGSGTRFWPLSRRSRPKQVLALGGEEPLLAATVRRIAPIVPPERTLIVTAEHLADAIGALLPDVPTENILAEPTGRNTAPCIGWAAAHVRRRDPDGVIAVLPSDHHIGDEPRFVEILRRSLTAAEGGDVVTIGIEPTRPETGYGYIEVGEPVAPGVHRALAFLEKPSRDRAEQLLAGGTHVWNSGMFFFRVGVILEAIDEHLPALSEGLRQLDVAAALGNEPAEVRRIYGQLPSVSIDHGVMEKAKRVLVVPGRFGWSDLGSWTTAWELEERDASDNGVTPDTIAVDARGCYVRTSEKKIVALVGVRDLIVVDTEDALLVVPRDRAQDVRDVVAILAGRKDDRY